MADRTFFTGPAVVGRMLGNRMLQGKARADWGRFEALQKAGFKLDPEADMSYYIFERLGGHYMDVGASGKIARGEVSSLRPKQGSQAPASLRKSPISPIMVV